MTALILCDGEPPTRSLLECYLHEADMVICADGACRWVAGAGCAPQVIIGDMDSSAPSGDCEVIDCGAHDEQENTDAEKALLLALERGAKRVILLGATGQRLDHTLANIWLVARYHDRAEITLADSYGALMVVSKRLRLATPPGATISLLPLTPDVELDTEGLKWPLHGPLEMGTRGLSNRIAADKVVIDVHTGLLAVIIPSVR